MKILVVDDSFAMRMMVVRTLRQTGIDTGDMPNMTGIELLRALRAEDIDVMFGFITTETNIELRTQATEAGAKFMVIKPFSAEAFEKVMAYIGA